MNMTNKKLAEQFVLNYAMNNDNDAEREELERRGLDHSTIASACSDLTESAIARMDEAELDKALNDAAQELAGALDEIGNRGAATFKKSVTLKKGESVIVAHVARGQFTKYDGDVAYNVDGEFGRSGETVINDWHGDYAQCKRNFFAYVGEKVLDGYTIAKVEVVQ